MTTLTPNYSLTTYAATGGDETNTFLNFRTALAGITNSNMTKIDTALGNLASADNSFVKTDGTRSMTGNLTTSGGAITVGYGNDGETNIQGTGNGAIELGKVGRTATGTPFIDFHSSAGSSDYDARIIASGGSSGSSGQGALTFNALNLYKNNEALSGETGFTMFMDNGTIALTTGTKVVTEIPFDMTLNHWVLASGDATTVGTATVVIQKIVYGSYPGGTWTTLVTTSISSGGKGYGTSFSNATLTKGDIVRANITAVETFPKLSVSLRGYKR